MESYFNILVVLGVGYGFKFVLVIGCVMVELVIDGKMMEDFLKFGIL